MFRVVIGSGVGAIIGGIIGYVGRCATGACPLTNNPLSGAVYGGIIGALIMWDN